MNRLFPAFFIFLTLTVTACSDDEEPLPDYLQELADLRTDSRGYAAALTSDDGTVRTVSNKVGGLKADSTYRVLALFTRSAEKAWLTSFTPILVPAPSPYANQTTHTDPLTLVAAWRGQRYINLRLRLKGTTRGTHYFGFRTGETIRNESGVRTLGIRLLHDQHADPPHYSREVFLSLPLASLSRQLTPGLDTIALSINTFDGEKIKKFIY